MGRGLGALTPSHGWGAHDQAVLGPAAASWPQGPQGKWLCKDCSVITLHKGLLELSG